jgi:hypothetical protein
MIRKDYGEGIQNGTTFKSEVTINGNEVFITEPQTKLSSSNKNKEDY